MKTKIDFWHYWLQENPALAELKKRLELDIE